MRRVFVIGDLPTWATPQAVEAAVRGYLEARTDVVGPFRVFLTRDRVNAVQIPDAVAADLRLWYAERLRQKRLTPE
jgi:hypothetical protein